MFPTDVIEVRGKNGECPDGGQSPELGAVGPHPGPENEQDREHVRPERSRAESQKKPPEADGAESQWKP